MEQTMAIRESQRQRRLKKQLEELSARQKDEDDEEEVFAALETI